MIAQDLPALFALLAIFSALIGCVEIVARRSTISPEASRKMVHLGGGIVCLAFPFFIESQLSVLALSLVMSLFFIFGRKFHFLLSLNRVSRKSKGSEYYPLAVWLVFTFTQGSPWFYIAALLVLAVADAGAALVGGKYGRHRYLVNEDWKSIEGSAVFLVLAFFGILLPLFFLSPIPLEKSVLSALLISLIVTGIEAISRNGRDNIFVPMGVAVILSKITTKPLAEVLYQNISLVLLSIFVVMSARGSKGLNAGGTIAIVLFLYAAWSLGSELWALPVAGSLLLFVACSRRNVTSGWWAEPLKSVPVIRGILAPFLILAAANLSGDYNTFLGPFVISCVAVTLSFRGHRNIAILVAETVILVFLPVFYISGPRSFWTAIILLTSIAGSLMYLQAKRSDNNHFDVLEVATASAMLVLAAQWLGVQSWDG